MTYLGIDPGRCKSGWALVNDRGGLLLSGIVMAEDMASFLSIVVSENWGDLGPWVLEGSPEEVLSLHLSGVLVGGGTTGASMLKMVIAAGLEAISVSEENTTLMGRELFWRIHPPRGLRSFFPLSLQVPPRDVDDMAAWVLVCRYLSIDISEVQ